MIHLTGKIQSLSGRLCFSSSRRLFLHTVTILTLLFVTFSASGQTTDTVKLVAFEYPPFYYEEQGQIKGIAWELVQELFHRMNRKIDISLYPLKRALYLLENSEADALMILIRTNEREEYLNFTIPVISVRGLIWYAGDRDDGPISYQSLDDLKEYTVGVTLGYSYGQEFDDKIREFPRVESAATDVQNFRKLQAHRIDIFPCNEILARGIFNRYPEFQGAFSHSDRSFILWNLRMGIGKESVLAGRVQEINRIISDLRSEGFVDAVVDKYIR